ncbi:MAG: ABC transporter permease [Atopobiaceae bacterium]|nr:ABC transporter permease [Atopobiaceae bacterium]
MSVTVGRGRVIVASAETTVPTPKTISARDAWYPTRMRDIFILRQLVLKDFKLKYRRSVLGVAWSVLNPLLMMAVMVAVFSHFMRGNDPSIGNYPLYLILGNTAFQLMNDATNNGTRSIIDAASLLKKVKINRYVFPVEKVLFAGVNYALSLVAIGFVMLFYRAPLTPLALLLPMPVFLLMVFCIGLSLMLSAAAVFFRDVIHLWTVIITAWTYATPLFYSINILPEWMVALENFNPMYHYVTFIRDVILWQRIPASITVLGCVVSALISLAIGVIVFKRHERKFILYI